MKRKIALLLVVVLAIVSIMTACTLNEKKVTITFDTNGGSSIAPITAKAGSTITPPTRPTKQGYTFTGWFTDSSCTKAYMFGVMGSSDITLYAGWTKSSGSSEDKAEYNIILNGNGGMGTTITKYTKGKVTALPTDWTREGYEFIGWYLNADFSGNIVQIIGPDDIGDKEFFAKWEKVASQDSTKKSVTLVGNGGTGDDLISYVEGEGALLPNNWTRKGYVFDGWYEDKAFSGSKVTAISTTDKGDKTYYAKWTKVTIKHSVILHYNDGRFPESMVYTEGEFMDLPSNLERPGYVFSGWYKNERFEGIPIVEIANTDKEDMQLYAKWSPRLYTITFDTNGGSELANKNYSFGDTLSLITPTKKEYLFSGWYEDKALTIEFDDTTMPARNLTLYASWTEDINAVYDIVIQGYYGVGTECTSYQRGVGITLPTDWQREGYTFKGFYEDSNYLGVPISSIGADEKGDKILYAKWDANSYNVSFDMNGTITHDVVKYGEEITFPDPIPVVGKMFVGWYVDKDFNKQIENTTMPANDMTIYAKYADGFNLTFVSFGEPISTQFIPSNKAELADITKTSYNEVDYIFDGWYYDATFNNPCGNIIDLTSDTTVYAKWTHRSFLPYKAYYDECVRTKTAVELNSRADFINFADYVMVMFIKDDVDFKLNYLADAKAKKDEINLVLADYMTATAYSHISFSAEKYVGSDISSIGLYTHDKVDENKKIYSINDGYQQYPGSELEISDKIVNGVKSDYTRTRSDTFENFKYLEYREELEVKTSNELFYALEHGIKPIVTKGTSAYDMLEIGKGILREICDDSMTDVAKTYAIFSWFIENVYYDHKSFNELKTVNDAEPYNAWHVEGVFVDHIAVCDGISKAFTILARMEGIPTVRVVSDDHAWNRVCLDINGDGIKEWYGLDATWGNREVSGYGEMLSISDFLFTDAYKESMGQVTKSFDEFKAVTDVNPFSTITIDINGSMYDLEMNNQKEINAIISRMHDMAQSSTDIYMSIDVLDKTNDFLHTFDDMLSKAIKNVNNMSLTDKDLTIVGTSKDDKNLDRKTVLFEIQ